jgi:WD40 repeat protein
MITTNSPYVGPRPFDFNDQLRFFGRNQEADKLLSLITAHPVVLLYAPSGAGKTSLLNAKLTPLLQKEGFDVLPAARVQSQTKVTIPHDQIENIFVFNAIMDWCGPDADQSEVAQKSLARFLQERKRNSSNGGNGICEEPTPRVVIFDQFEEIFRLYPERWKDRYSFFEQVRKALAPSHGDSRTKPTPNELSAAEADPLLRVLFVMREDYIAGLDSYMHLLPEKLRTRFRLEHLREKPAKLAITEPLKNTGRSYAPGVAEELVANLLQVPSTTPGGEWETGQYVEPVTLQVVCDGLWLALDSDESVITREHLNVHGDVNQALSAFYDRSIKSVAETSGVAEAFLRTWFERKLIRSEGVRGIVYRGDTHTAKLPNSAVDELDKLHLIKGELRGSSQWYELAHDRLIGPIKQSNERWVASLKAAGQTWKFLENRADEWDLKGRSSLGLLNEGELNLVNRWSKSAEAASVEPSKNLTDLIDASRAALSSRKTKRMRWAFAGALSVLIVMSFTTIAAIRQRIAAQSAEDRLVTQNLALSRAKDELTKQFTELRQAKTALETSQTDLDRRNTELQVATDDLAEKNTDLQVAKDDLAQKNTDLQEAKDDLDGKNKDLLITQSDLAARASDLEVAKDYLDEKNKALQKAQDKLQAATATAKSGYFAAESKLRLDTDPVVSERLAVEAATTAPTAQAADALRAVLLQHSKARSTVLDGHLLRLNGGMFSPNGQLVLTISDDNKARLWKQKGDGWEDSKVLSGHTDRIATAAFSPDGKLIATAGFDKTVRIWQTETGSFLRELKGHDARIALLVFSPDGSRIVTEAADRTARVWEVQTGTMLFRLEGLAGPFAAVAFSRDGRLLATEWQDPSDAESLKTKQPPQYGTKIWNMADGRELRTLIDADAITALAFSPASSFLVTASRDNNVQVWNTETWQNLLSITKSTGAVTSISFSRDGEAVILAGGDTAERLAYDVKTRKWREVEPELRGHNGPVVSAAFSRDGKYIVTGSLDNTARIWDALTGESLARLVAHTGGLVSVAFSPDQDNLVLTASQDHTARVWEFNPPTRPTNSPLRFIGSVIGANFSPDGNYVLSNTRTQLILWDAKTRRQLNPLNPLRPCADVQTVPVRKEGGAAAANNKAAANNSAGTVPDFMGSSAFSPDGKLIVAGCLDGTVRVWDLATATPTLLTLLKGHTGAVVGAEFSQDGKHIVTASADKTALIWDWEKAKSSPAAPIALKGHTDELTGAAFSRDGRYVVTASNDGTARIWEAGTGTLVQELASAKGELAANEPSRVEPVIGAAFSPDGLYVVTGGKEPRVWSVGGQLVLTLCGHTDTVYSAEFSHDGKLIVTASADRTARVWDFRTGQTIAVLRGHNDDVISASFSTDDKRIITASSDRTARIHEQESFETVEVLLRRANELGLTALTPEARKEYLNECKNK